MTEGIWVALIGLLGSGVMAAIVIYKNLDDRRLQRQNAAERAAE